MIRRVKERERKRGWDTDVDKHIKTSQSLNRDNPDLSARPTSSFTMTIIEIALIRNALGA